MSTDQRSMAAGSSGPTAGSQQQSRRTSYLPSLEEQQRALVDQRFSTAMPPARTPSMQAAGSLKDRMMLFATSTTLLTTNGSSNHNRTTMMKGDQQASPALPRKPARNPSNLAKETPDSSTATEATTTTTTEASADSVLVASRAVRKKTSIEDQFPSKKNFYNHDMGATDDDSESTVEPLEYSDDHDDDDDDELLQAAVIEKGSAATASNLAAASRPTPPTMTASMRAAGPLKDRMDAFLAGNSGGNGIINNSEVNNNKTWRPGPIVRQPSDITDDSESTVEPLQTERGDDDSEELVVVEATNLTSSALDGDATMTPISKYKQHHNSRAPPRTPSMQAAGPLRDRVLAFTSRNSRPTVSSPTPPQVPTSISPRMPMRGQSTSPVSTKTRLRAGDRKHHKLNHGVDVGSINGGLMLTPDISTSGPTIALDGYDVSDDYRRQSTQAQSGDESTISSISEAAVRRDANPSRFDDPASKAHRAGAIKAPIRTPSLQAAGPLKDRMQAFSNTDDPYANPSHIAYAGRRTSTIALPTKKQRIPPQKQQQRNHHPQTQRRASFSGSSSNLIDMVDDQHLTAAEAPAVMEESKRDEPLLAAAQKDLDESAEPDGLGMTTTSNENDAGGGDHTEISGRSGTDFFGMDESSMESNSPMPTSSSLSASLSVSFRERMEASFSVQERITSANLLHMPIRKSSNSPVGKKAILKVQADLQQQGDSGLLDLEDSCPLEFSGHESIDFVGDAQRDALPSPPNNLKPTTIQTGIRAPVRTPSMQAAGPLSSRMQAFSNTYDPISNPSHIAYAGRRVLSVAAPTSKKIKPQRSSRRASFAGSSSSLMLDLDEGGNGAPAEAPAVMEESKRDEPLLSGSDHRELIQMSVAAFSTATGSGNDETRNLVAAEAGRGERRIRGSSTSTSRAPSNQPSETMNDPMQSSSLLLADSPVMPIRKVSHPATKDTISSVQADILKERGEIMHESGLEDGGSSRSESKRSNTAILSTEGNSQHSKSDGIVTKASKRLPSVRASGTLSDRMQVFSQASDPSTNPSHIAYAGRRSSTMGAHAPKAPTPPRNHRAQRRASFSGSSSTLEIDFSDLGPIAASEAPAVMEESRRDEPLLGELEDDDDSSEKEERRSRRVSYLPSLNEQEKALMQKKNSKAPPRTPSMMAAGSLKDRLQAFKDGAVIENPSHIAFAGRKVSPKTTSEDQETPERSTDRTSRIRDIQISHSDHVSDSANKDDRMLNEIASASAVPRRSTSNTTSKQPTSNSSRLSNSFATPLSVASNPAGKDNDDDGDSSEDDRQSRRVSYLPPLEDQERALNEKNVKPPPRTPSMLAAGSLKDRLRAFKDVAVISDPSHIANAGRRSMTTNEPKRTAGAGRASRRASFSGSISSLFDNLEEEPHAVEAPAVLQGSLRDESLGLEPARPVQGNPAEHGFSSPRKGLQKGNTVQKPSTELTVEENTEERVSYLPTMGSQQRISGRESAKAPPRTPSMLAAGSLKDRMQAFSDNAVIDDPSHIAYAGKRNSLATAPKRTKATTGKPLDTATDSNPLSNAESAPSFERSEVVRLNSLDIDSNVAVIDSESADDQERNRDGKSRPGVQSVPSKITLEQEWKSESEFHFSCGGDDLLPGKLTNSLYDDDSDDESTLSGLGARQASNTNENSQQSFLFSLAESDGDSDFYDSGPIDGQGLHHQQEQEQHQQQQQQQPQLSSVAFVDGDMYFSESDLSRGKAIAEA